MPLEIFHRRHFFTGKMTAVSSSSSLFFFSFHFHYLFQVQIPVFLLNRAVQLLLTSPCSYLPLLKWPFWQRKFFLQENSRCHLLKYFFLPFLPLVVWMETSGHSILELGLLIIEGRRLGGTNVRDEVKRLMFWTPALPLNSYMTLESWHSFFEPPLSS